MKVIIAGSRHITQYYCLLLAVEEAEFCITEIVSGGARGVDALGERLAQDINCPLKIFPAKWEEHGKRAGPLRNIEMADYADALVALWDGKSRGTKHMIEEADRLGLRVHVFRLLSCDRRDKKVTNEESKNKTSETIEV